MLNVTKQVIMGPDLDLSYVTVLLLLVCPYSEHRVNVAHGTKRALCQLCYNKAQLIWPDKVLVETLRQLQRGRTTTVPLIGFSFIRTGTCFWCCVRFN